MVPWIWFWAILIMLELGEYRSMRTHWGTCAVSLVQDDIETEGHVWASACGRILQVLRAKTATGTC